MSKRLISGEVKSGRVLVSDGAWGTFMQKLGLKPGECPELWNLERPEDIRFIAQSYIDAGADMVETNSFGANRIKLERFGLSDRAAEINREAARLSRAAAGGDKWVLGSMGPTGKMLIAEEVTEEELYEAYKEQAEALADGGADALCVETMSDIEEARTAVRAAKENTGLEVICTFAFERTVRGEYRTMMGVSPAEAARAMAAAGADIIGANCGNGIAEMIKIVDELHAARPDIPILVHANAGLPERVGGEDFFPDSPSYMAGMLGELVRAGANIVGGCCGATPEHIRAMREAVRGL